MTDPAHNVTAPARIDQFTGPFAFLSNFHPVPIAMDGLVYPSVEHAYQAAKTLNLSTRAQIQNAPTPELAKAIGRAHQDRPHWEEIKVDVMRALVEHKFTDPELRARLLATGSLELVEGNTWRDEFWGVSAGRGQNMLGLILMAIRSRAQRDDTGGEPAALQVRGAVERAAQARIPTPHGIFTAWGYRDVLLGGEQLALTYGEVFGREDVLIRVHSECVTGEALGSLRCDCGPQLDAAMEAVAAAGTGVIVYLRGHEGRGIGLLPKLRAYALQDAGFDTVDANTVLGLPADGRSYQIAAQILIDLGITSVRLLSNNPGKAHSLARHGVMVTEQVPLIVGTNGHNLNYLGTKRDRMGHQLPALPTEPPSAEAPS